MLCFHLLFQHITEEFQENLEKTAAWPFSHFLENRSSSTFSLLSISFRRIPIYTTEIKDSLKTSHQKTGHYISVNPVFISNYYEINSCVIQFAILPVPQLPHMISSLFPDHTGQQCCNRSWLPRLSKTDVRDLRITYGSPGLHESPIAACFQRLYAVFCAGNLVSSGARGNTISFPYISLISTFAASF